MSKESILISTSAVSQYVSSSLSCGPEEKEEEVVREAYQSGITLHYFPCAGRVSKDEETDPCTSPVEHSLPLCEVPGL